MATIAQAFGSDDSLHRRIIQAIDERPDQKRLFEDIATYHLSRIQSGLNGASTEEPAAKKRKLDNGIVPVQDRNATSEVVLEVREVSFSIPQRKKLHFRIVQYSGSSTSLGVQAVNPANGTVEYELPSSDLAYVLRTPVPEKATKQYNFIFVPSTASTYEPVLFTIPATPLKGGTYTFPDKASTIEEALDQVLRPQGRSLTLPDENEFASATPESHRKNEKAFHVKAFRGSKDGFLFFLANGIFFGFKKPLLFLPFDRIESISYTSVLQRTFNLNIAFRRPDGEEEEIEFSMLDQSDYSVINDYIQRHGLNDASLAAGRRAKIESKKKTATNGDTDAADDDGRTEIEKAEAELQDEEDELEEDFEPSDEDDDGSGSDEESDDENYDEPKRGKDLVQDELGSEAEDVEVTDDEAADEEDDEMEADEDEPEQSLPVVQRTGHPASQGRWGATINSVPDPDDDDQL